MLADIVVVRKKCCVCIGQACGTVEHVKVARHVLLRKVKQQFGVDRLTKHTRFKVKVRTERTARIAAQTNRFASLYLLIGGYKLLGKMSVDGFKSVVVAQHYIISITSCIVAHHTRFSVKGCDNRVASINFNIKPFVNAAESRAITVTRGNIARRCRHTETAQINLHTVG